MPRGWRELRWPPRGRPPSARPPGRALCQQGQSPHRSLRPLVGDPLHSPHTTHTPFVRTGESYGSTFPANFVEEPLQYHLALPAQRSRFWVTFASLFERLRNLLAPQYTRRAVSSRSSRTSDAVGRLQLVEKGTCREITKPASALAWSPLPHSQQLLRVPSWSPSHKSSKKSLRISAA